MVVDGGEFLVGAGAGEGGRGGKAVAGGGRHGKIDGDQGRKKEKKKKKKKRCVLDGLVDR